VWTRALLVAALTICTAAVAAGCGGERQFEPSEFVAEANGAGAGLLLGEALTSNEEDREVRTVSFAEEESGAHGEDAHGEVEASEPDAGTAGAHEHEHGAGSLVAFADVDAARTEYERCGGAVSLICFRAANVVLRFEGIEPADRQRLEAALVEISDSG
jgi:hypothetical protein